VLNTRRKAIELAVPKTVKINPKAVVLPINILSSM